MIAKESPSQVPPDPADRLGAYLRHFEHMAGNPKGMVLGQYHILEELGRGGYGRVYKAEHTLMNRQVALKLIAPDLVEDKKVRAWFRREVMALTLLNHPNIVMAYDADEIDTLLFLVMEYVDGPNLEALIARQGPLPVANVYPIMQQTALALQYAHEKGMVHRDIKPENLLLPLVTGSQANPIRVKIADFGLARLHPRGAPNNHTILTELGGLGTPAFIAPEQAENIHAADIRSDLYSLGCTIYYALSGSLPFPGPTGMEILAQHLKREAKPLEELRPDIPSALAAIIRRLMAKNPDKRFQSPADLASELSFLFGPGAKWAETISPDPQLPNTLEQTPCPDALPSAPLNESSTPLPAEAPATEEKPQSQDLPNRNPVTTDSNWNVYWHQWFAVVKCMARGENPRIHEANYQAVQRELLRLSKGQAALTTGVPHDRFLRLIALVEPWLTPHSLAALDKKTLSSLFESCDELDREVDSKPASWQFGTLLLSTASFLVVLVLAFWFFPRTRFLTAFFQEIFR
jgi:serine/threonine protein kinase